MKRCLVGLVAILACCGDKDDPRIIESSSLFLPPPASLQEHAVEMRAAGGSVVVGAAMLWSTAPPDRVLVEADLYMELPLRRSVLDVRVGTPEAPSVCVRDGEARLTAESGTPRTDVVVSGAADPYALHRGLPADGERAWFLLPRESSPCRWLVTWHAPVLGEVVSGAGTGDGQDSSIDALLGS